jgi:hypothetical protein
MKKTFLALVLVGLATLGHATECDLFSNANFNNNSYSCSSPFGNQPVSDCTITFTSLNCNNNAGSFTCNFGGDCDFTCQNDGNNTWSCTLDSDQINCLNSCLNSGNCNFNVCSFGDWSCGGCQINYDCCPPNCVPDSAWTVALLGAALLTLEFARRKLVSAGAR